MRNKGSKRVGGRFPNHVQWSDQVSSSLVMAKNDNDMEDVLRGYLSLES